MVLLIYPKYAIKCSCQIEHVKTKFILEIYFLGYYLNTSIADIMERTCPFLQIQMLITYQLQIKTVGLAKSQIQENELKREKFQQGQRAFANKPA